MSQSCVHQHTCSYTPGTHDPRICPMHCKISSVLAARFFLLHHPPIPLSLLNPTHSHSAICHPSSSRSVFHVGWASGRQQQNANRNRQKPQRRTIPLLGKQVSKSGVSHQGASSPYPKNWGGKTLHFLPRFNTENPVGTQDLKRRVLSPTTGAGPKRETRGPAARKGKCPGEAR